MPNPEATETVVKVSRNQAMWWVKAACAKMKPGRSAREIFLEYQLGARWASSPRGLALNRLGRTSLEGRLREVFAPYGVILPPGALLSPKVNTVRDVFTLVWGLVPDKHRRRRTERGGSR